MVEVQIKRIMVEIQIKRIIRRKLIGEEISVTCNRERSRRERDLFWDLGQGFQLKLRRQREGRRRLATKEAVVALWILEGWWRWVGFELVDGEKRSGRWRSRNASSKKKKKNQSGKTKTKKPSRWELRTRELSAGGEAWYKLNTNTRHVCSHTRVSATVWIMRGYTAEFVGSMNLDSAGDCNYIYTNEVIEIGSTSLQMNFTHPI